MSPPAMVAYMLTTPTRREVREQTIANLAKTDWGASPVAFLDPAGPDVNRRVALAENKRRLLESAIQDERWDVLLFLEDDLAFNRHLRHNLENWPPIATLERSDHLCGSLYDPNIGSLDPAADRETCRIADPQLAYGSQAVVLSRATINWILDNWLLLDRGSDLKIFRLAGQKTPVYYHRPSLVEHLQVPSTWGGVAHEAVDYSESFRAPTL